MNENLDKLKMQETQQETQHSPMEQLHVEKFLWKNMIDEYKPILDNPKEDVTRQAWELSKEENGQPGSLPLSSVVNNFVLNIVLLVWV